MTTPRRRPYHWIMTLPLLFGDAAHAEAPASGYLKPPQAVADVLDALPPPDVVVGPTREHLLLLQGVRYHGVDPRSVVADAPARRVAHRPALERPAPAAACSASPW